MLLSDSLTAVPEHENQRGPPLPGTSILISMSRKPVSGFGAFQRVEPGLLAQRLAQQV